MKIRNGFVSNSSSSSFVAIGFLINNRSELNVLKSKYPLKDGEGDYEWEERLESELKISVLCKEPGYIVGKILADVSSDGDVLDYAEYSLEELKKYADEIEEAVGDSCKGKIKLLLGTRPS